MRACNAPFFRVVKVFNKKAVRKTNPWEFGQGAEWYKNIKIFVVKNNNLDVLFDTIKN